MIMGYQFYFFMKTTKLTLHMEDNDMSKFSNKSNHKGEQRKANIFIPDDLVREALQEKGEKLTPELADSLVGNATNYFLNVISIYKDLIAHDKNITTEALNVFQTLAQNPNLTEEQSRYIIDQTVKITQQHNERMDNVIKVISVITKIFLYVLAFIAILAGGWSILLIFWLIVGSGSDQDDQSDQ